MLHQNITEKIIKSALTVYNDLGCGFLEKVYRNALAIELKENNLYAVIEKKIDVFYKNNLVGLYYADIFVENKIILEIKCVENVSFRHILQTKNYLSATEMQIGLIFNFKNTSLEFKRIYSS